MQKFEYLALVRDKAGRWQERGTDGDRPVDLEARVGALLTAAATPLSEAMLLNGYGQEGWEMALGTGHDGGDLNYLLLKRPQSSRGGRAGGRARAGLSFLTGAVAGALAIGLAALLALRDDSAGSEQGE
jgi:hypothetical protein